MLCETKSYSYRRWKPRLPASSVRSVPIRDTQWIPDPKKNRTNWDLFFFLTLGGFQKRTGAAVYIQGRLFWVLVSVYLLALLVKTWSIVRFDFFDLQSLSVSIPGVSSRVLLAAGRQSCGDPASPFFFFMTRIFHDRVSWPDFLLFCFSLEIGRPCPGATLPVGQRSLLSLRH